MLKDSYSQIASLVANNKAGRVRYALANCQRLVFYKRNAGGWRLQMLKEKGDETGGALEIMSRNRSNPRLVFSKDYFPGNPFSAETNQI